MPARLLELEELVLGEGKLAQVPPVVVVGARERLQQRELLFVAVDIATEADKRVDPARLRQDERIGRKLLQVLAQLWHRVGAALDGGSDHVDVLLLAAGRASRQLPGAGGPGARLRDAAGKLVEAGQGDMGEREAVVVLQRLAHQVLVAGAAFEVTVDARRVGGGGGL